MPLISLLFKRPRPSQIIRTIAGSESTLILDATLKEGFKATAELTKHPVERGADVGDHVVLKAKTLSISGIVTVTPLGDFPSSLVRAGGATAGALVGKSLGKFGGAVGALAGGALGKTLASAIFGTSDRNLGAISAEFVKVRDAKLPVSIQTGLQLYKDYILTSFSASRKGGQNGTGGSIEVDLEFEEIIFVDSQTTDVAIPKVPGALNAANLGRQTAEGLDDAKNGRGASILKKLFGGAS
jgi:hypothetical protein